MSCTSIIAKKNCLFPAGGVTSPTYQVFLFNTKRVTPNQYLAQLRATDPNNLYPFMVLLPTGAIMIVSGAVSQFYRYALCPKFKNSILCFLCNGPLLCLHLNASLRNQLVAHDLYNKAVLYAFLQLDLCLGNSGQVFILGHLDKDIFVNFHDNFH